MKINKVLNNNLVFSKNKDGEDIIVAGLGIGFQKIKGDEIEQKKIEKIFQNIAKKESTKLIKMLNEIPIAYFNCTEEILKQNQEFFENNFTNSTVLALTDHIYFLIKRIRNEQYLPNQFGWEIQRYYPKEYKIALSSLEIINQHFEVNIPEEEASNLVLHFMSIQQEGHSISERTVELRIIQDITNIVKYELKNEYNENGLSYERFLIHLKFFVRRIFSKEKHDEHNFLYEYVQDNMEEAFKISKSINIYLNTNYEVTVSQSQLAYLTVHIQRLQDEKLEEDE
ncbi:PRD domain-containing protein [Enterococcus faecium]|uniref:PRD domain-containing protein n=1 Tax=Enterococcus TaxID=1350 RepID=UPI000F51556B|nr:MULTISPECIES: PRD domain-containing protein [Enterococcus]MBC9720576.1 PRD domain-containing protein [Lactobacillus sp.]NTM02064.1 PRD domain-containing protein [Enterococcus faecium]ROX36506.1 PRD domain-containing protein [Enterococcus faecium]ROY00317.1 PRD domain-containing protein [Enterococcus faecium]